MGSDVLLPVPHWGAWYGLSVVVASGGDVRPAMACWPAPLLPQIGWELAGGIVLRVAVDLWWFVEQETQ